MKKHNFYFFHNQTLHFTTINHFWEPVEKARGCRQRSALFCLYFYKKEKKDGIREETALLLKSFLQAFFFFFWSVNMWLLKGTSVRWTRCPPSTGLGAISLVTAQGHSPAPPQPAPALPSHPPACPSPLQQLLLVLQVDGHRINQLFPFPPRDDLLPSQAYPQIL